MAFTGFLKVKTEVNYDPGFKLHHYAKNYYVLCKNKVINSDNCYSTKPIHKRAMSFLRRSTLRSYSFDRILAFNKDI